MRRTSIGDIVSGLIRIIYDSSDEATISYALNMLKSEEIDNLVNKSITDNLEGLSIQEKTNVMKDIDLWYLVRKDIIEHATVDDLIVDRTRTYNLSTGEDTHDNAILEYINSVDIAANHFTPNLVVKDSSIIGADKSVDVVLKIVSARYKAFNIPTYGIDRERIAIPITSSVYNLSEMVLALIQYRYNR